jgi:aspartyl-tRNA synthetase
MTYDHAMRYYGSDKPDLRFDMPIHYLTDVVKEVEFPPFKDAITAGGDIACINAAGCAHYTRKQIDAIVEFVKEPHRGITGLVWVKWELDGSIKSSADKFFDAEKLQSILDQAKASKGDMLLIGFGKTSKVQKSLGDLRLNIAEQLGLKDRNKFSALWVIDFPMFDYDEESDTYVFMHHPFTSPQKEDIDKLESDKANVKAYAYDFVINGMECGGGSIRIHDRNLQSKVFEALGLTPEEAQDKFGFLLDALQYGAPPHGGIAFGFDRLCAIMVGTDSIRDVMAFPKNNAGKDLMLDAPGEINPVQRKELGV